MRLAQNLYEDGSITYMRTDGVQMTPEAVSAPRKAIADRYDAGYVPDKPRHYETKAKNAQEAHEAIRPTDFGRSSAGSAIMPGSTTWSGSVRWPARWRRRGWSGPAVDLADGTGQHVLRATGQVVLFPGFLALYEEGRDDPDDENRAACRG